MADTPKQHPCFNCETPLSEESLYCPRCGQKVDNNNLKLGVVLKEFFENYISFDTQLGRSVLPFLFRPGHLTLKFNNGIRKNFANPFRLYIILSIFFFFISTHFIQEDQDSIKVVEPTTSFELREFAEIPEPERKKLNSRLSNAILLHFNDSSQLDSSFTGMFNQLSAYRKKRVSRVLTDSIQEKLDIPADSVFANAAAKIGLEAGNGGIVGFSIEDFNMKAVESYIYNSNYSDRQILDSLDLGVLNSRTEFVYLQIIKSYRAGNVTFARFIVKNISFALFAIIPFTALLFFLFYFRRRKFYVEHLIHSIHLHSFVLFIYGITLLLINVSDLMGEYSDAILFVPFLASLIYIFKSFLVVYGQGILRTVLKFLLIGSMYWFFFTIFILIEVLVSFLLF